MNKIPQSLSVTEATDVVNFCKSNPDYEPLGKCDLIDIYRSTIIEYGHNKTSDPYRLLAQACLEMNKHNCCVRFVGAIDDIKKIKCYIDLNNFTQGTRYTIASKYASNTNDITTDAYKDLYALIFTNKSFLIQGLPSKKDRELSGNIIKEFEQLSIKYPSLKEMQDYLKTETQGFGSFTNKKYNDIKLLKDNISWGFFDKSIRLQLGSFYTPLSVKNKAIECVSKFIRLNNIKYVWDPMGGDGDLVIKLKDYLDKHNYSIDIFYSDINPIVALKGMCRDFLAEDPWYPNKAFEHKPDECFIFTNPSFNNKIAAKTMEKISSFYKISYGLFIPSYQIPQDKLNCVDGFVAMPHKEWEEISGRAFSVPFIIVDKKAKKIESINLNSCIGKCKIEFVPPKNALSDKIRIYHLNENKRWQKKINNYEFGLCFQEFRSLPETSIFWAEFPKIEHLQFAYNLCKQQNKDNILSKRLQSLKDKGLI